jgi:hypothetical protein
MAIDSMGSLLTSDGRVRHFGRKAFVALASDTTRCFVCGALAGTREFNDEHVIPDWLLGRFNLHSRRITFPNGKALIYGRYTLRCCEPCNSLLGKKVETPMSQVFAGDYDEVCSKLKHSDPALLYQWLCLLFIKAHLKDRDVRADPDLRNESPQLGDYHDWDGLHHIHSVARASQSGAKIDASVPGTTFVFPMQPDNEPFDFGDLSEYSTVCIRIGSVGVASVLNDCGRVAHMVAEYLSGISGPLSGIQLREIGARLAYGNELLSNRPTFWSELAHEQALTIRSSAPDFGDIPVIDRLALGRLMAHACGPLLLNSNTPNAEEKIKQLERAEIQFLYRDDGTFIAD